LRPFVGSQTSGKRQDVPFKRDLPAPDRGIQLGRLFVETVV
jgi:hypothetical protein